MNLIKINIFDLFVNVLLKDTLCFLLNFAEQKTSDELF